MDLRQKGMQERAAGGCAVVHLELSLLSAIWDVAMDVAFFCLLVGEGDARFYLFHTCLLLASLGASCFFLRNDN